MDTIIFFVVAIVLVAGWMWLKDKLWEGTTRAVFRGSHQKGQTATHTTEHFRAPVSGEEFMRGLLNFLNLPLQAPNVMGGLHVGVATGEATVLNWQEANGLVSHTADIERIFKAIEATCQHFQGEFTYTRDPG